MSSSPFLLSFLFSAEIVFLQLLATSRSDFESEVQTA